MPAIDIARLKTQAAVLVEKFDQPVVFLKGLHEILDLYADRTLRAGLVASPVTVLPAYRTPPAVLRQIEMELAPLASTFPEQAMSLTDALWKDGYLETRLLAATLLGRIHPETPLLIERISAWAARARDQHIRSALLNTSLGRLRRESPVTFLKLISGWLDPASNKMWSHAIYALLPLLEDPSYENLPPVYNAVSWIVSNAPSMLQNDIVDLVKALYIASPVETTYFLRQTLSGTPSPEALLTFRRIIPSLPPPLQPIIQELVRRKKAT
jgi:hypothetical protein